MNDNKICFIIASNNEIITNEIVRYIDNLDVPQNISTDIQIITGASSITQAYNYAMNQSDAKYKVYLHQDLFIVNRHFIYDILKIFENKEVGMIGTIGCKRFPYNGTWWEGKRLIGKTMEDKMCFQKELAFESPVGDYEEVMAVDGQIMITQYDLPWREDVCMDWHFYDSSQSLEFIRAGYKVVIPKEETPWFIHECGNTINKGYEGARTLFLQEYEKDIKKVNQNSFLVIMGDPVCYNILNSFAEEFINELKVNGFHVDVFDISKQNLSLLTQYFSLDYLGIVGFQCGVMDIKLDSGQYLVEFIHGPKFNFVFDHPLFIGRHFHVTYKDYYLLTVDRNHKKYIERYYKNIAHTEFLPPAGISHLITEGNHDEYDVVFIGTCHNYRECLKMIKESDPFTKRIASRYLQILKKQNNLTQEEALQKALLLLNYHLSDEEFNEYIMKLSAVSLCIVYYYREKLIKTLCENGVKVHVFGDCWQDMKQYYNDNLCIGKSLTTKEYMEVLSKAKIGLNIMPWNKDGFTERIANIMIEGALCATDCCKYVEEEFQAGEDLIIYDLNHLEEFAQRVKQMLANDVLRKNIALNGKKKAMKKHTWEQRTKEFLALL